MFVCRTVTGWKEGMARGKPTIYFFSFFLLFKKYKNAAHPPQQIPAVSDLSVLDRMRCRESCRRDTRTRKGLHHHNKDNKNRRHFRGSRSSRIGPPCARNSLLEPNRHVHCILSKQHSRQHLVRSFISPKGHLVCCRKP